MPARYAVYVAPRPDGLWRFGSGAIGYDAESGRDVPLPPGLALPADWRDLTAEPRRYGFHGTLKAPFHLAPGRAEQDVLDAAARLAAACRTVEVPRLRVATLGSFLALVPDGPAPGLHALATACVEGFDSLRAPLTEDDRRRRLAKTLTERQRAHLDRWGYPYVLDDFRFHLTLTGPLREALREPVRGALAASYGEVEPGLAVDALAIYRQESRDERFRVLARVPFTG